MLFAGDVDSESTTQASNYEHFIFQNEAAASSSFFWSEMEKENFIKIIRPLDRENGARNDR